MRANIESPMNKEFLSMNSFCPKTLPENPAMNVQ